jgi:flagellar protein FliS
MLYDRLVRDLIEAEQALDAGDHATGTDRLRHAQEIVMELQSGLDPTKWSGGPGLAQLYAFLLRELIGANIAHDGRRVARCRALVEPLRDAWHQAAAQIAAG